jgi:hypothetical protein
VAPDRALFVAMLREEWRLHATLFGGMRFAAFPLAVAVLATAGVAGLELVSIDPTTTIAGIHLLLFFFGLQTGSIGLVGRDAIENLLGDTTLLVFSGRTLPLSRRRLLAHFLLRDLVYYAGLFVLPLAVAFAPLAVLTDTVTLSLVPRLFVSLSATFALGLATTTAVLALAARGVSGGLALLGSLAIVAWLEIATPLTPVAWSPYGLVTAGTPADVIQAGTGTLVALATLTAVGIGGYEPTESTETRVRKAAFERWQLRLGDEQGLVVKHLFDVMRSAGGLWKVAFSGGVLFAVSAALLVLAGRITGIQPAPGIAFGAVLSLSAFTTYNWLTSAADLADYQHLPVSVSAVLRSHARAFALLGPPVAIGYLLVALLTFGTTLADAAVGVLVLVGFQSYLFGLTVWLAGTRPNEFLFDTLLFGAFFLAVAIPMIPVLVVAVAVETPSDLLLVGVATGALALGLTGRALLSSAGSRWERRLRSS